MQHFESVLVLVGSLTCWYGLNVCIPQNSLSYSYVEILTPKGDGVSKRGLSKVLKS